MTDPLIPPRLRNDCFAMPQGVDWIPVHIALEKLRETLHPVTSTQTLAPALAIGRILAAPAIAARANPPRANSAVDGYGFAHASTGSGIQTLPLVAGRAAAGGCRQRRKFIEEINLTDGVHRRSGCRACAGG